jgi:hypothetical protein
MKRRSFFKGLAAIGAVFALPVKWARKKIQIIIKGEIVDEADTIQEAIEKLPPVIREPTTIKWEYYDSEKWKDI